MLLMTHYAQNYAGIIGRSLAKSVYRGVCPIVYRVSLFIMSGMQHVVYLIEHKVIEKFLL